MNQARLTNPPTSETKNNTRKRKNNTFAIPAAAATIPQNPKTAATNATTKKISAQRSIFSPFGPVPRAGAQPSNFLVRIALVRQYTHTGITTKGVPVPHYVLGNE